MGTTKEILFLINNSVFFITFLCNNSLAHWISWWFLRVYAFL